MTQFLIDCINPSLSGENNFSISWLNLYLYSLLVKMLPAIKYLIITYTLLEDEAECEIYKKKALSNGMSKKELTEMLASYS